MDPLSLAASIIAVLGVGGTISKGLRKIYQMKQAPEILLQLNNEITDFTVLVLAVDELYRQYSDPMPATQQDVICRTLERAKHMILELEKLVEYVLTRETNLGSKISRIAWMRSVDKLKEMKDGIRRARNDLNAAWVIISNRNDSKRIELQLLDMSSTIEDLRPSRQDNRDLLDETVSAYNQLSDVVPQKKSEESGIIRLLGMSPIEILPVSQSQDSAFPFCPTQIPNHSRILHISVARTRQCTPLCRCSCHQNHHYRSPSFLDSVIGGLFFGYNGRPFPSLKCDIEACQKNSGTMVSLKHAFPSWMVERIIYLTVLLSKSEGPELIVRLISVRPLSSILFQLNMHQVRDLSRIAVILQKGKASVLDVDNNGRSGLWYATRSMTRRYKDPSTLLRVRFLLQQGADPLQNDHFMQSAYHIAWKFFLGSRSPQIQHYNLIDLFGKADPIDELGFGKSHIAVLELHPGILALDSQLGLITRDEVDQEDYTGRTSLSWATQRGDVNAIEMLLRKGANPNKDDIEGKTPFIHCDNDPRSLRLLLEAGAHVNHADKSNITKFCYTIIHNSDITCLDLLFRFGSDLNQQCGGDGDTPLSVSIKYSRPSIAEWLLEKEVEINSANWLGKTPLLHLIGHSGADISVIGKQLLDRGANYRMKDNLHEGLLHYVARYLDSTEISWLRDMNLTSLSAYE